MRSYDFVSIPTILLFSAIAMNDYYISADLFLDMWIYVVIKAGLKDLVSYVIIAHPSKIHM